MDADLRRLNYQGTCHPVAKQPRIYLDYVPKSIVHLAETRSIGHPRDLTQSENLRPSAVGMIFCGFIRACPTKHRLAKSDPFAARLIGLTLVGLDPSRHQLIS
jgi:hypothetical protein